MWLGMLLMWLIPAAFVGLIVWLLLKPRRPEDAALAILKRRVAAGEISEAEYARLRELLK